MRTPDFFIVGAPKCGTTALDSYLGQHPAIFMGRKELHYFGSDLTFASFRHRLTEAEYLSYFEQAPASAERVGESSVWYLYSERAPEEIKAFEPRAQIIILLRNPTDLLYSLHSQSIYNGDEVIEDFEEALDAEPARRRGEEIPAGAYYPPRLFYRDVGRYVDRVQKYLSVFGEEQVRIILFDDLKENVELVYKDTLRFLCIDDSFEPPFPVVNSSQRVRNPMLRDVIWGRSMPFVNRWARNVMPVRFRQRASEWMQRLNSRDIRRPSMPSHLRRQLAEEFTPDVHRLSELIRRDLSNWLQ
jgi:hypothetical protein